MVQQDLYIDETVQEARTRIKAGLDDGVMCPCCGQFAKRYSRRLNAGMVASLCWLVKEWRRISDWVDVPTTAPRYVLKNRELSRLQLWGLASCLKNDDSNKKNSGMWIPTMEGDRFVRGVTMVWSHAVTYNGNLERLEGKMIDVHEALGKAFDYKELMGG